jgi:hypothetical protein
MNLYPIFTRELRSESRSDALRRQRVSAGLITGLLLAGLMIAEHLLGNFNVSKLVRWTATIPLGGMMPFALLVIGLSRAGHLFEEERREGILPLLLLTLLSGWDIVLGKLLQALLLEVIYFLAMLPAMLLPLIAFGFQWSELWHLALGAFNVMFFALALGLFAATFGNGPKAVSWCLLLLLPFLAHSTPLGLVVPAGPMREYLAALRWLNPCEPLAHLQMVLGGIRPSAYWGPLVGSHATAWGFVILGGWLLPRVSRWQNGANAGPRRTARWRLWRIHPLNHSPLFRRRLLDRNPFLWLTSRVRWTTPQIWLVLALPTAFWGWLTWVSWAVRGLNITYVLVMVAAASWLFALLIVIPSEACKQLVQDRLSGALEMVLCTPVTVKEIIRGQWLALRRRYLFPVLTVIFLSAALMITGYVTFGFGGMLDPEDRGLWLFWWITGICLLPVVLTAFCWISMRRALFATNLGQANGGAFLQAGFWPGIVLGLILGNSWSGYGAAAAVLAAYFAFLITLACRARAVLLRDLHEAAANRFSCGKASDSRLKWLALSQWLGLRRGESNRLRSVIVK